MNFVEVIIQNCFSLIRLVLGVNKRNSSKQLLLSFKNKSNALILGNGPSLTQSLELYQNEFNQFDLIAVNRFPETDAYTELKPSILVLLAPQFFKPDSELSQEYILANQSLFEHLAKKTAWPLLIVAPANERGSKQLADLLKRNKYIKVYYIKTSPMEGLVFFKHLMFSLRQGMPRPHNVLIPSLMIAIQAKYEQIAIVGADHSWLKEISVAKKNEALVHQKHFYDENSSSPKQMADYIVRPRKLHEILHKFYLAFKGYWEISNYAKEKGVRIVNCSETSMIDAFERGTINSITKRN